MGQGRMPACQDWNLYDLNHLHYITTWEKFGAGDASDAVIAYMAKTAMYAPPPSK